MGRPADTLHFGLREKMDGLPGVFMANATTDYPKANLMLVRLAWVYEQKHPEMCYTSIQVIRNHESKRHRLQHQLAPGLVVTLGQFNGGGWHTDQEDTGMSQLIITKNHVKLVNLQFHHATDWFMIVKTLFFEFQEQSRSPSSFSLEEVLPCALGMRI